MKVSPLLSLKKIKHETLGYILELSSPVDEEGRAAYDVDFEGDDELGLRSRLTKKTALKLATELKKLAVKI